MYTRTTTVVNCHGLHARPAGLFVREAARWKSGVEIANLSRPEKAPANAKSIIAVLALGISRGCEVALFAEGEDETQAVDALVALIEGGLGEGADGVPL